MASKITTMEQIWKDIPEYEGRYQISNDGRVRSLERKVYLESRGIYRTVKEITLKGSPDTLGYPTVALWKENKLDMRRVHRLVAEMYVPNQDNKPQVNHIDGDKTNNNFTNLEWVTMSENIKHAYKTKLIDKRGEKSHCNKLTEEQVNQIRNGHEGLSQKAIGSLYGVDGSVISKIRSGKAWKHSV